MARICSCQQSRRTGRRRTQKRSRRKKRRRRRRRSSSRDPHLAGGEKPNISSLEISIVCPADWVWLVICSSNKALFSTKITSACGCLWAIFVGA